MKTEANKFHRALSFVMLSLFLCSCESLISGQEKLTLTEPKHDDENDRAVVFKQLENRPPQYEPKRLQAEIYPGGGLPVSELAPQLKKSETSGPGSYSLNFDEADLGEVAKVIISDILAQNYVLSPKVVGTVTLQTTQPLTREQLLPTLEMLLNMNNAALVKDGGVYHIEPAGEALYSSALSVYGDSVRRLPDGYRVGIIPVRYVGVDDISAILKQLVQEKTLLYTDASRNLLVVGGTAAELERVKEIVAIFDINVLRGRSFALFPLAHVDPATLIDELNIIFEKKSQGKDKAKGEGGTFFRFVPIERLNAILAITHQSRYLADIENWINRLDRANAVAEGGIHVYRVQHVQAKDLAATLSDIFGSGGQQTRPASVAPGLKKVQITNKQQSAASSKPASQGGTGAALGTASGGKVRFIADEVNNALIIVATAREYTTISKLIEQLDIMPLQVLIDATIVDVTLKNDLQYGIEWYLSHSNSGQNLVTSGTGAFDLTKIATNAVGAGLGYSFVSNSGDIRALLRAEATKNNINVISSPSLMVLNNQEATIQVGAEISLRTSQNTPLTGTVSGGSSLVQTNQLTQRQTGVKLKVKPRVNASGLVIMEITQSVEDVDSSNTTPSAGGNPPIQTREITSSVAVHSGETLVLGGLIKKTNNNTKTGIPYLNELPLIGSLFGSTHLVKDKTELVVLITPRVVTGKQNAREVSAEFKRRLTGIYKRELPGVVDAEDFKETETAGVVSRTRSVAKHEPKPSSPSRSGSAK